MTDQQSPSLSPPVAAVPEPDQAAADGAASLLEVTDARLSEISHLAARLYEVSGQAQVAALNLSLEIARDGGAKAETENALADEVRRLAERTEAVALRLPGIVERLEAAHRELGARLGAAPRPRGGGSGDGA